MHLRHHCLRQFQQRFLPQTAPHISFYCSPSTSSKHSPSRKGRQAVRRLLKLLPHSQNEASNPQLSDALITLRTSPETLSSAAAATLISAVRDPLLSFNFYRFLRSSAAASSVPFNPDAAVFFSLLGTQLLSRSPHLPRIRFYLSEAKRLAISFSPASICSLISPLLPDRLNLVIIFLQELFQTLGPAPGFSAGSAAVLVKIGLAGDPMELLHELKHRRGMWKE